MRFYLDTNILIFLITSENSSISSEVWPIIIDYSNYLLTSSACVHELIHLCQIGKVSKGKQKQKPEDVIKELENLNIQIKPVTSQHLTQLAKLPILGDHRDPFDRLIVSQAISDKISLISSDTKFDRYNKYGLNFIYNER